MKEIEIGELSILVMGVHLSLRNQPYEEKKRVATELGNIISCRLNDQFEGDFRFEIISIENGCIKVKLKLFWEIACKNAEKATYITAALVTIAVGAQQLFGDEEPKITIKGGGITCEAKYSGNNFIQGCHYIAKTGDNLSTIVSNFSFTPYTKKQAMVALYRKNKHAFYKDNMNNLKSGEALIFPSLLEINKIGSVEAAKIFSEHLQEFHGK